MTAFTLMIGKFTVKKAFASRYLLLLLVILITLTNIYQYKIKSFMLLKQNQKEHLIQIKIYQKVKVLGLQDFDFEFKDVIIKGVVNEQKLDVFYLDKQITLELDDSNQIIK